MKMVAVFNGRIQQLLTANSELWLKCHNEDTSKKFVATGILLFDIELFKGIQFDHHRNKSISSK